MADEDIGSLAVRVALDDSNFSKGMQNLKKNLNVIDSSFRSSIAGVKDWGKSLDNLRNNAQALGDKIEVQRKIVQGYSNQIDKMRKTLTENATTMNNLKTRVDNTTRAYEQSKAVFGENDEQTKKLKSDLNNLTKEYQNSERTVLNNNKSIQGYTIQMNNAQGKLKDFESQLDSTNKKINNFKLKSLSASLKESSDKFKTVGETAGKVGDSLLTLTVPLIGVGVAAGKVGMDFETSMSQAAGALNKPMNQMGSLRDLALKMGADTQFSATQAGSAITELAKGGLTEAQIKAGALDATQKLAASSGMQLGDAANTVVQAMGAFGLSAGNASQAVNALAGSAAASSTDVEPLTEALQQCSAGAHLVGWSIQDTTAVLGAFADKSLVGSDAGTSLKTMLQRLTAPTGDAAAEMQRLGINVRDDNGHLKDAAGIAQELQTRMKGLSDAERDRAMNTIFGSDATRAASIMMEYGAAGINKYTKATNDQTAAARLAKSQMGETQKAIEEMKGSLETAAIKLEGAFAPAIKSVADTIGNLADAFGRLSPGTQKFIVDFVAVTAVTAGAFKGIQFFSDGMRTATDSFSKLAEFMAAHDLGAKFATMFTKIPAIPSTIFSGLTTGLSVTGTAISKFITGPWLLLGNGFRALPNLIKNLSFTALLQKMIAPLQKIPLLFTGAFGKIPGLFTGIRTAMAGFGTAIIALGPKILTGIRSMFSIQGIMTGARAALALFTGPWGALILGIAAGVGAIIANWSKIRTFAQNIFGGSMTQTFTRFRQVFTQVWAGIQNTLTAVWAYIGPTIIGAVNQIKLFWNQTWPLLEQVFVEVWNVMKVVLAPAMTALYIIISTGLGVIRGIWGPAWSAIGNTLKLAWDAITGVIRIAWDIISGVIKVGLDLLTGHWSQAWSDFKSIFSNVWSDLRKSVSSIAKDALNWGKDIIKGIIDGIKSGVKALGDAVKNVAEIIKKHLHFSVPDEGPLSDFDEYMPDMMQLMADGIEDNTSVVTDALDNLGTKMQDKIQIGVPAQNNSGAGLGPIPTVVKKETATFQEYGQDSDKNLGQGFTKGQNESINPAKKVLDTIGMNVNAFSTKAKTYGQNANKNLGTGITASQPLVVNAINTLTTALHNILNLFSTGAIKYGQGANTSMMNGIVSTQGNVTNAVTGVTAASGNILNAFSNASIKYGVQTDTSIATGVSNTLSTVMSSINNVIASMRNALQSFASSCVSIGQSVGDSIAQGMQNSEKNATDMAKELAQKIIAAFQGPDGFDVNSPSRKTTWMGEMLGEGAIKGWTNSQVLTFFKNEVGNITSVMQGSSKQVAEWLSAALAITGQPLSALPALEQIAMHESGGNPLAVNNWDINAQRGDPSKGLMQIIGSNFAKYHLPGLDNIYNPIANAAAAIRYMLDRYGSIWNVPGVRSIMGGGGYVPYASGTNSALPGWQLKGENGPELEYSPNGGETILSNKDTTGIINIPSMIQGLSKQLAQVGNNIVNAIQNLNASRVSLNVNANVSVPTGVESSADPPIYIIVKDNTFLSKKGIDEFTESISNKIMLNIKRRR